MQPLTHEHRLRVRYGETDQMGVVYHANYLVYMEEGRTGLMHALKCPYAELERRGWGLAVRRANLRFRAPARYDDELLVRTRLTRLRGASVTFTYEIFLASSEEILAEGDTELACLDMKLDVPKPTMLPDELRRLLDPHVQP